MEIPVLRSLYNWVLRLAAHRRAGAALFALSFAESSFFPIPPDVLLIPMALAHRARAWFYAALATSGSVAGAVLGYALGFYFYDLIAQPLIQFYGAETEFEKVRAAYDAWGLWFVAGAAFTPIPYKVITIASGVFGYALLPFLLVSLLGRGARFFLVAGLLWRFGVPMRAFIEKYLGLLSLLFFALLLGAFVVLGWLL